MKLYYSPGACSLASHIAMHEAGLSFTALKAPTSTHKLDDGTDYYAINPLGYVPLLQMDDGSKLTEGPAILQYIATLAPAKKLAPAAGTLPNFQMQSWLTYISTELHKGGFSLLFNPMFTGEQKTTIKAKLAGRLAYVDKALAGKDYLMGADFSVADAYLFTVTNWAPKVGVDMTAYSSLATFRARMTTRPGVQAAMKAEGLI
jgi:glutathione S-transferase